MRECRCPVPNPRGSTENRPYDDERCVRCGYYISPRWTTNPRTFAEFSQRLDEAMFAPSVLYGADAPGPPSWYQGFRADCQERYLAGQSRFGYHPFSFLERDNTVEGKSEAADGANYAWFQLLKNRHDERDEEWALLLTAAYHAARMYEAFEAAGVHRHGAFSNYNPAIEVVPT